MTLTPTAIGPVDRPVPFADGVGAEALVQADVGVLIGPVAAPAVAAVDDDDALPRGHVLARGVEGIDRGVARADDHEVAGLGHRCCQVVAAAGGGGRAADLLLMFSKFSTEDT